MINTKYVLAKAFTYLLNETDFGDLTLTTLEH